MFRFKFRPLWSGSKICIHLFDRLPDSMHSLTGHDDEQNNWCTSLEVKFSRPNRSRPLHSYAREPGIKAPHSFEEEWVVRLWIQTEWNGSNGNESHLHFNGAMFESQSGHQLSWPTIFVVLTSSTTKKQLGNKYSWHYCLTPAQRTPWAEKEAAWITLAGNPMYIKQQQKIF
jgi:hypothetical protein